MTPAQHKQLAYLLDKSAKAEAQVCELIDDGDVRAAAGRAFIAAELLIQVSKLLLLIADEL